MNINATIILQAVNFWIAYCIFRFILLKPAYAAIMADTQKREKLERLINDDEKRIAHKKEQLAQQWNASYLFFKEHRPAPTSLIREHYHLRSELPSYDAQERARKERSLADAIVASIGARYESR